MGILTDVKKSLGLAEAYDAFDAELIMYINTALSTLNELGVGPAVGVTLEDGDEEWDILELTSVQDGTVRTYVSLRARMLLDPPSTSFHISAMERQIEQFEWRLNTQREWENDPVDPLEV